KPLGRTQQLVATRRDRHVLYWDPTRDLVVIGCTHEKFDAKRDAGRHDENHDACCRVEMHSPEMHVVVDDHFDAREAYHLRPGARFVPISGFSASAILDVDHKRLIHFERNERLDAMHGHWAVAEREEDMKAYLALVDGLTGERRVLAN